MTAPTYAFGFNPAGQAILRTISNVNYRYAPPAVSQSYSRDGLNRYTAVGSTTYTYDTRQNLTSDGSLTYLYDLENRLTSITGTPSLTLSYDPLGRLRTVTTGGLTTTWLWDGDRLVAEYDNAGALSARYAHGPGPDEPLTNWFGTTSSTRLWFHQDHQNTTIAMSDGTGAISGSALTYDAYGQPAGGAYSGPRFRYTGQTSLPGAPPLWHYKARAYAPGIGRFLQVDPIGYKQSLNLYTYVGNDPFNLSDPSGMCWLTGCPQLVRWVMGQRGTVGVTVGGHAEAGHVLGGASGQGSVTLGVSSDGRGNIAPVAVATRGHMAGETNDRQTTLGASAGLDVALTASTAERPSDLTGSSQTTTANVGPISGSLAQSETATTVTLGGGVGAGVSGSSYETETVDLIELGQEVVAEKLDQVRNLIERILPQ